jgi:hypothetical protein
MSTLDQLMDASRQANNTMMQDRCQEIIEAINDSDSDVEEQECYSSNCTNLVSFESIYNNDLYCEDCHFTCCNCKQVCTPDNAASGLFEGSCINCTRCDDCNVPMWDYVCQCSL